ncbi:MAG: hypothetical protein WCH99_03975 [Verrucomicrobiota bacterium]
MEPRKTIQDIQLDLIERASFNQFDGQQVKQDLNENKHLWKGVIMGRFDSFTLIPLRDIAQNIWNVDTLMILPQPGKENELQELAVGWCADDIELIEGGKIKLMYGGIENKVVRVWWD